ncbi:indole-3-glycerol phosphate synthase TrpC [Bacillus pinisoli]|uniref:indole-3-glycerol phosphate synthase TrpC n=1 Tax=Bacillus pinisoli TaxID=2901866 RepID=UPI001FF683EC|nr:indole-3-glycerol phosphate synthase TrpC [Bacillus pinisoli]
MLNKIIEVKHEEMLQFSLPVQLEVPHFSLYEALRKPNRGLGLIAEVKKASPSKGVIREDFHPVKIAEQYVSAKADALSVLTDEQFFHGSKQYLSNIKQVVNVPILRKDFIVDRRQLLESKYIGADAVLLIGEVLEPLKLKEFYLEATEIGLECLVEVHSIETVEALLKEITPTILGINNRDLSTFKTSVEHTKEIITYLPKSSLVVSESGIHSYEDLSYVKDVGAHAVLIGEAFMREDDPGKGIERIFGEGHLV